MVKKKEKLRDDKYKKKFTYKTRNLNGKESF